MRTLAIPGACTALLLLSLALPARAADSAELRQAFDSMMPVELDPATTCAVHDFVLTQPNCEIHLDSGRIAFFAPVTFDSVPHRWAAWFKGEGRFQFDPPVEIERDQVRRFYESDSLNRSFNQVLLLISDSLADAIALECPPADEKFDNGDRSDADDRRDELTRDENFYYLFAELKSLSERSERPFFMANFEPDGGRTYFTYNPYSFEEIRLLKRYWAPGYSNVMETVCSYHEGLDSTYRTLNGSSKWPIAPLYYVTDGEIDRGGKFTGSARMKARVLRPNLQLLNLNLHPKLKVDSVVSADNSPVEFIRYKNKDNESLPLYLLFDRPQSDWDTLDLTFYYNGDIARAELGIFDVTAGALWYPHIAYQQDALFDMTFRTPIEDEFVATGTLLKRDTVGDTLVTRWQMMRPSQNASFSIGPVRCYRYTDKTGKPVDIYYSEAVHEHAMWEQYGLGTLTNDIQDQVAKDVIGALDLFSRRFGPYPYRDLRVSEIFRLHGEAFPGFLQLGTPTWLSTDQWGDEQLFRSHEVAHQWWGVGVGAQTYHDSWLAEGFSEYSGLLYVQSALGDDRFYDRLKEYRDDIFSARKYIFGLSGAEAGPIILGIRTQSSKTKGDYELVIYKKGACVLHMLRWLLTDLNTLDDARFYEMLADYYRTYAGRSASTADFQKVVEKYADQDMDWFFREWVFGTDLPEFRFEYNVEKGDQDTYVIRGTVKAEGISQAFRMPVPVEIEYSKNHREYRRLLIDRPQTVFSITGLSQKPKKVRFNPFQAVLARVKQ